MPQFKLLASCHLLRDDNVDAMAGKPLSCWAANEENPAARPILLPEPADNANAGHHDR